MRRRVKPWATAIVVIASAALLTGELAFFCRRAAAFPGLCGGCCFGGSQSLSAEIHESDIAVIARLVDDSDATPLAARQYQARSEIPKDLFHRFEIVEILKGAELLCDTQVVDLAHAGNQQPGSLFLIQASSNAEMTWGTPLALNDQSLAYVRQLPGLPENGPERLKFFHRYLHDADELISRDANEELILSPYADLKAAKDIYDHDQLVAAIRNEDTLASHRRLYLNLLGIVSRDNPRAEDLRYLERELNSNAERKPCLDAMIGCYLTLKGAAALPMIEDKFLKDPDCSYSDTYSAIMALRFHAQDEDIIPRRRVLSALRLILYRPELADLVMPDLIRWEDWSVVDRLVRLFKNADDTTTWIRIPVIQYLRACPLPEAKLRLQELAEIDPTAVRKAKLFAPLGTYSGDEAPP